MTSMTHTRTESPRSEPTRTEESRAETAPAAAAVGFWATLASEWRKQWTLRSNLVLVATALFLGIGMSALLCTLIGVSWSEMPPEGRAGIDPLMLGLAGILISDILLVVLAARNVAGEYSTGMIRLTLAATPRRSRVLTAELLVIAVTVLAVGSAVTFGGFHAGQAILASYGADSASIGEGDVLRTLVLTALADPVMPLLAACLAVLLRSSAGTIATMLGLLFVPSMFGVLLPEWWQVNLVRYLPGYASENLVGLSSAESLTFMEPAPAAMALVAWLVVGAVAAYTALARRDA